MYYVYILRSEKDGKLYTGRSDDLKQRYNDHKTGIVESTKHRRPLTLIYYEAYRVKEDAIERELFLKSGRGREVIKKQIKHSLGA